MKNYEIMYVLDPITKNVNEIVQKFDRIINTNKGNVVKTDIWGEKRLAYEIKGSKTGIYILVTFAATPFCIKELDRNMRIDEAVLRYMIISK